MSENHYPQTPSPISIHPANNINKQKNDYNNLPNLMNQWSLNKPDEFENREKYMETQLTEEHGNQSQLDGNANQNNILDDGPYPPLGLKRFVTGQTISFDEESVSPPFDRIIPGKGDVISDYSQPYVSKPEPELPIYENKAIPERYVFGSTTNGSDFYSSFYPTVSKKENSLNTNDFYAENSYNSLDYLDNFIKNSPYDAENSSKVDTYQKNKSSNISNGFQNHEIDKRDFFQPEKSIPVAKLSSNNFDESRNKVIPDSPKESDTFPNDMKAAVREDNFTQNYESFVQFSNRGVDKPGTSIHQYDQYPVLQPNSGGNQEDFSYDVPKEIPTNVDRKSFTPNVEVPSLFEGIPRDSSLTSFRHSSVEGNDERVDSDGVTLERGTVPGAQSTPSDNLPNRQFQNSNNSYYYNLQNVSRHESDSRINKPYPFDTSFNKSKIEPPLERRMVVGETSSDIPVTQSSNRSRDRDENQFEEKPLRSGGNLHFKDKDSNNRYEKGRKKPMYDRRERRKVESDEEDYEDYADGPYDNSPDCDYRSYREKHYRNSPRRVDKRSSRRDHENSFPQSQDESYYDDEDDDYDHYRNQRKYYQRRYHRDSSYKQYNHDSYYRDERGYRDPRMEYCGSRYEEESYYRDGRNSRPSSRSGSEYRRNYPEYSNSRFYNKPPFYEYLDHRPIIYNGEGPRMNKKQIDFWSNVREVEPLKYMNWFKVTFPKEYAQWYAMYAKSKMMQTNSYQADRRGSGHSGQSSVNNDLISVNEEKTLDISQEQTFFKPVVSELSSTQETRCTPAKFAIPHVKGFFNSLGQLVMVNACSPMDGQSATIDIYRVTFPEDDMDNLEFKNFTGPFIVGETHVNTLSEFLKYHANMAVSSSEKLLYLLIDLIIKLRGVTDGVAISELLMKNYDESQEGSSNSSREDFRLNNSSTLSEFETVENYTKYLLQGDKNTALGYAIDNRLWGHAFLLASKMGQKYYGKVLAEFDSTIATNSPLKTLYQLYSKRIPKASTACADDKWGDWRPHLAMILSNPTADKEFDKTAIITLGDSLSSKDVYASQFCYLAAQVDFDFPNKPFSKYTLLSLQNNMDLGNRTPNHPILLTQTYEFAKRLQNDDFTIISLLPYKFLLATRLLDYGKVSIALQYLETIALDLIRNPCDKELIYNVSELSEKLRFSDSKPLNDDSSYDKQWIADLREVANKSQEIDIVQPKIEQIEPSKQQFQEQVFSQPSVGQSGQQYPQHQQISSEMQPPLFMNPSTVFMPPNLPSGQNETRSQPWETNFNSSDTRNMISDFGYNPEHSIPSLVNEPTNDGLPSQSNDQYDQNLKENQQNYYSPWDAPQPAVSISTHSSFSYFDSEDSKKQVVKENPRPKNEDNSSQPTAPKESEKNTSKGKPIENGNKSGWLGGILGKISLKPKNQMILPDDTDKSLIWSEEKQRWVDRNGNSDDESNTIKPPPKASELNNFQPMTNSANRANEMPPIPGLNVSQDKQPIAGNNFYKLSRGRGMKSNYVNVLSQNTKPTENLPPPNLIPDPYSSAQVSSNMKMFVSPSDGNSGSGDASSNPEARPPNMPLFYNPAQYGSLG